MVRIHEGGPSMMRLIYLFFIILIFVLTFKWSVVDNAPYWYYEACHFLMGLVLAGFLSTIFPLSNKELVLVVLGFGIGWEILEFMAATVTPLKIWLNQFHYHIDIQPVGDTALDLVLDVLGSGAFILLKHLI